MSTTRRAVITGVGPVSPIGIGVDDFWSGLQAGKSAIRRASRIDTTKTRAKHTAEIDGFQLESWAPTLPPKLIERTDRHTRFALAAAQIALADAGLTPSHERPDPKFGVSFGTALGGISDAEEQHVRFATDGPRSTHPALALQIFGGAAHSNLAIAFGLQGPATTTSNSCASGNVALLEAVQWIREGRADVVLAGASEAPIAPLTFSAFDRIGAMSRWEGEPATWACRPFDVHRDGFVMGEGAAAFVIESQAHAQARGAKMYAELAGGSLLNEAYHMTTPRPGGELVHRAMEEALIDAATAPDEVDYLSPHASSTQLNDSNESLAIGALFGANCEMPATALKAYVGHALGAASALEAVTTLLAMDHGWIPPCLHIEEEEPTPLNLMSKTGGLARFPKVALSNAFGFGGTNSCLVFKSRSGI